MKADGVQRRSDLHLPRPPLARGAGARAVEPGPRRRAGRAAHDGAAAIRRRADRRAARSPGGTISWTNSVTNLADARRMMGGWADTLVAFLDRHYKK